MTRLPELGDEIGPLQRQAPSADEIRRYGGAGDFREAIFSDDAYARGLGFRGLVVPGPLLAAYVEQFLHHHFPDWCVEWLSTTFRLPSAAGDILTLRGAITEDHHTSDGERIVCDVVIEHPSGDRAVTASARLRRIDPGAAI
jgi:hypothetical protein